MIGACIDSCLAQTVSPERILVVNDGSTDNTADILASYGKKIDVLPLAVATGNKSYAQEIGLKYITTDIFIATDGDTVLDKHFIEVVTKHFRGPAPVAAVSGYVRSMRHNYLTGFREVEYAVGQDIHKQAQSYLNFLLVIPGCAGVFDTKTFKSLITFDHDTLTEDLDFTYKFHKAGLRIVYERDAVVYTQDPPTLLSYINQMRRWYGGGWQNLMKHGAVAERPNIALELSLTYIDGLLFSALFFGLPFVNFVFFLKLLAINTVFFALLGAYAAITRRRPELFLYSFLGVFFSAINGWIFLEQFLYEVVWRKTNLIWFHPERRAMRIKA